MRSCSDSTNDELGILARLDAALGHVRLTTYEFDAELELCRRRKEGFGEAGFEAEVGEGCSAPRSSDSLHPRSL